MAPSPILKALGFMKDQETLNLALMPSHCDPELEILIIKSTTHDKQTPHITHTNEILHKISSSSENLIECVSLISKRIERTHDWIVVLKCLILVHRLIINGGGKDFVEEIDNVNSKCGMLSNLCYFRDLAHSNSWDYTEFVRRYGMYIVKKVELMEFDEMWLRKRKVSSFDDLKKLEEKERILEVTHLRDELVLERVLSRMERLQRLLQRVLDIGPRCVKKHRKLVVLGFTLVVKESFELYSDLSEGLSFLLDRFWGMGYLNCVKVFGVFATVAKQFDDLGSFYVWCKGVGGVDMPVEYPKVEKIGVDLLRSMEESVKKKLKEAKGCKRIELIVSNKKPENNAVGMEFDEGLKSTPLGGEVGKTLAMSDQTTMSRSSNVTQRVGFLDNGESSINSGCEALGANPSNPNCEITLVGSETDLPKQKPDFGCNFDAYLVNGIYHQNGARQLSGGSASGLALPWPEVKENQVWTLPSIEGSVQMMNQDPFAGSQAVPPPSYLQLAELEKKHRLLVQEQQLWQEYVANGMQGQVNSLVQNRPSISTVVPQEMLLFPW